MWIQTQIDWMTATIRSETAATIESLADARFTARCWLEALGEVDEFCDLTPTVAQRFYKYSFIWRSGVRIDVAEDLQKQGIRIVFSGRANVTGQPIRYALANALPLGFSITRLDVAIDVHDGGLSPVEMHKMYVETNGAAGRKTVSLIASDRGSTFTVGSRKSPLYVRCYDKAAEQGIDEDWLRIEGELKGYAAVQAAHLLAKDETAASEKIFEYIGLNGWKKVHDIALAAAGDTRADWHKPEPINGGLKWWRQQVLPAFAKLAQSSLPDALEIYEALGFAFLQEVDAQAQDRLDA